MWPFEWEGTGRKNKTSFTKQLQQQGTHTLAHTVTMLITVKSQKKIFWVVCQNNIGYFIMCVFLWVKKIFFCEHIIHQQKKGHNIFFPGWKNQRVTLTRNDNHVCCVTWTWLFIWNTQQKKKESVINIFSPRFLSKYRKIIVCINDFCVHTKWNRVTSELTIFCCWLLHRPIYIVIVVILVNSNTCREPLFVAATWNKNCGQK